MASRNASATLLGMPLEIQLHILSYTPMQSILRCRILNREFQALIDDEKNRQLLATHRLCTALQDLRTKVARLNHAIFYFPLLEALRVFLEHRGIQLVKEDRYKDAKVFAAHRLGQVAALRDPDMVMSDAADQERLSNTAWLIRSLVELHLQCHLPSALDYTFIARESPYDFLSDAVLHSLGLTRTEVYSLFTRIETPYSSGGILPINTQLRRRRDIGGFPNFPLTPLKCSTDSIKRKVRFQGFCSALELVDLFDLPDIGDKADFAWYTEKRWVFERVQQTVYGQEVTPTEKAVLVEEFQIY